MKLKSIGTNQHELTISARAVLLFSYDTLVAACIDGEHYASKTAYSPTTKRHVKLWLEGVKFQLVEQEFLEKLCRTTK